MPLQNYIFNPLLSMVLKSQTRSTVKAFLNCKSFFMMLALLFGAELAQTISMARGRTSGSRNVIIG